MKYIKLFEDYIKGGKADDLSIEDITKIHSKKSKINYNTMLKIIKINLEMCLKVEAEHTP